MEVLRKFFRWFLNLLGKPQYSVRFIQDIPSSDEIQNNRIYLVGNDNCYWCGVLKCPCGCGESIHLNLIEKNQPSWKTTLSNHNRVSVSPSIWKKSGCKSHFFIREGKVIWA